jgi:hypothetical protein
MFKEHTERQQSDTKRNRLRDADTKTDRQIDMDTKGYRQRDRKTKTKEDSFKDTFVIKESSTLQSFFKLVGLVLENLKPI